MPKTITIAHSPDSDDAFMFWAMSHGKIPTGDFQIEYVLADIETLNQRAAQGTYEITAVSIHAYAYLAEKYALMPCGASMGDGYGPIVVTREEHADADLKDLVIGIPGMQTTAYLALKLYQPDINFHVMPFDEIMDRVVDGEVGAGLLIHEGQLTYEDSGLVKLVDLGEWWLEQTGLPLPLGGNAIRRDLSAQDQAQLTAILRDSIQYALEHREVALRYATQFGRGLGQERADQFVGMYVNDLTLDYGERGRRGVEELLQRAYGAGLIPAMPDLAFVK